MNNTYSVRRPVRGFTLVELLVVTLILSILMAVALPLYLSSVADARTKTCQANMQTIANAVQAAHVKAADADYSAYAGAPSITAEPDLQGIPKCPNAPAGTTNSYTIETITSNGQPAFDVKCNNGDGTFTPGVGVSGATGGNNGAGGVTH